MPDKHPSRPWTAAERTLVVRLRNQDPPVPFKEIAKQLGRRYTAVESYASKHLPDARRKARDRAARLATVRRLYRRLTAPQLARLTGVTRSAIYADLRALGLPCKPADPAKAGRRGVRAATRRNGGNPLALYVEHGKLDSAAAGWPAVDPRAARHLEAFERHGPGTAAEHAARGGWTLIAARARLRDLTRAGHLVVLGRKNRWPVYALAPAVAERRFRHRDFDAVRFTGATPQETPCFRT